MEGIQHRWDCPNPDDKPEAYTFEQTDGATVGYVKCRGCGRAAIVHRPKGEPDERRSP